MNHGWNPGVAYDRAAELQRYRVYKARLLRELNAPPAVALKTLDEWKELWRSIHDRDVDYASGLMNVAHIRFREASLEDLLRSAPYYFNTIDAKHDFSWNKEGVCQYCSHCAMMTGKLPIERFGYPLRVVDPPLRGDTKGRCSWTIYKDLRDVPAAYYEQLGEKKPEAHEPLGSGRNKAAGA